MLELRINGKTADIKQESIIAVTKMYESVSNPLNFYADWSKTVQLPISPNNNAIFSNFNRLDSTVTNLSIDPAKKIPCMILNNQEPVLEGYCKLENANTIYTDEKYEITIYSTFGLIMNDLKLLTFNKNAVGVDPMYIINSPLSDDLIIDRNLVKRSFEQTIHRLDSDDVIDWIGFIPTYQGKYSDFSSDKEQLLPSGRTDDMSRERDEHYMREFRSYYQQPFIWVDKLWKVAKDKIESITDYSFNLDGSWFTSSNPYYKDLIYTCPSLFNSDDNYKQSSENFIDEMNVVMFNKPSKNPSLSTHQSYQLYNLDSNSLNPIYDPATGIFNTNADFGSTKVKGRFKLTLFASIPGYANDGYWYCKITDANPFYIKIKAVNTNTGQDIYGAKKTFLIYSDDYDVNSGTFDEKINVGICNIANTGVNTGFNGSTGYRPMINHTGYQTNGANHAWECDLNFELNVTENVPYKVYFEVWNANNGDPFEYTSTFNGITWDWLWADHFNTSFGQYNDKGYSMYFDARNVSCETTENLRTGSNISLYRVFPKDVTLCDVLLNYSKMFGLVWDVNEDEKTVTVMTRNRFFSDYHIEDWTDKIDRSKEFKFSPLTFEEKYVEFNFEEGECGRLKNYQSTYQVNYGNKKLDTGYDFNSDTNNLMEKLTPSVISQKRQYSCMMNTEYEDRPNFMGFSYMVYPDEHYVDNDNEGKNAGMSGAFYFRNGIFVPDSRLSHWDNNGNYVIIISDDSQHMIQTQEFCWNSCGDGITVCYYLPNISTISNMNNGKRYSVHFEVPKEYYFEAPSGNINYIYHSFWENYINERYCSQNKKLTAYVYLSLDEFKAIDFREFIKIDNILYHIDKVYDFNYNSNEPVKMDLVQVWNLSAYTNGQDEIPYLFTVPQSVDVTTTYQTIPVYTSYSDYHIALAPSWIDVIIDGNGDLSIRANSAANEYRTGTVILLQGASPMPNDFYQIAYGWRLAVSQYPTNPYRLEVDRNTLLFDSLGGSQTVIVDCHDTSNNAITVTVGSPSWLNATISEYTQTFSAARRDCLHLVVTAAPRVSTISRHSTVTLSITANGTTYTQRINVGQQGGTRHTRNENYRLITDIDSDLEVMDSNNTVVNTLVSGQVYHFEDLFPEEIDIHSVQITGGGSVNVSGSVGLQTVEFIPQLSDGDQVGGGLITAATLNGNIVSYAYDVQVQGYTPEPPTPPAPDPSLEKTYFYIEDISGSDNTLTITKKNANAPTIEVFCSTDQVNWESMGETDTIPITATVPADKKLYLKAVTNGWCDENDSTYCNRFLISDNCNVGGNIMSLLYGDNFIGKNVFPDNSKRVFSHLFAQWSGDPEPPIVNAEDLILPAVVLNNNCYEDMFSSCDNLLTTPKLPAITLANYCYSGMFYHCTSLTTPPQLPATELVWGCYANMFWGCTSLTQTPSLPTKILKGYCYSGMFSDCSSLNEVTVFADDISATNCLGSWLSNVAATGDFYNNGSAVYTVDSPSGIPQGWTEHSSVPVVTPDKRHIIVDSGENGMFTVDVSPSVMQPKTTNFFEYDLVDGTVVKLTAVPNEEMTFSSWLNSVGGTYTTPVVTFTVGSALVDADGNILYKCEFVKSNNLVTLTVNGGGGYITVGGDSTHYDPLVRRVPAGTTITNLTATWSTLHPFNKWSDGSTRNNRDYTVTTDTTLTAIFNDAGAQEIILDGNGLIGVNDYLTLSINGTPTLYAGIGETDTTKQVNATYSLVAQCNIKDLDSKFNWFKETIINTNTSSVVSTNYYYNNPASYSRQLENLRGYTITVSTVPSYVYWTNDNGVDYVAELYPKQDWLLDPVFKNKKYDREVVIDVDHDKPLTLVLTTDWKLEKAVDDQDRDVLAGMTESLTSNGSWIIYFYPDTRDATQIKLYLVKA